MRRNYLSVFFILLAALWLGAGQTVVTAEPSIEEDAWDTNNAVLAYVSPGYADQVLPDVPGFFSYLDLKASYVVGKYENQGISVILVLNKGGEAEQEKALARLQEEHPKVGFARVSEESFKIPFESVRTMNIVASSDTIHVGDILRMKVEGEYKVYERGELLPFDEIEVSLSEYDPQKEYTPADFPQFEIAAVINRSGETGNSFLLKLAEPGFFNMYKALNAFSLDPAIIRASIAPRPTVIADPGPDWLRWTISDPSIADFEDRASLPQGYGGEITIKGHKEGKTTITYQPSLYDDYKVSYEINVIEVPTPDELNTGEGGVGDFSTQDKMISPKTGESPLTGIMLLCTMSGIILSGYVVARLRNLKES